MRTPCVLTCANTLVRPVPYSKRHAGGRGLLVRLSCTSLWGAGVAKTIRRGRVQTVLHGGGRRGQQGRGPRAPRGPTVWGQRAKVGRDASYYPSRPSAHISPTPSLPACLRRGVRPQYSSRLSAVVFVGQSRCVRCCVAVRYPHRVSTKDPKQSLGPTRMSRSGVCCVKRQCDW